MTALRAARLLTPPKGRTTAEALVASSVAGQHRRCASCSKLKSVIATSFSLTHFFGNLPASRSRQQYILSPCCSAAIDRLECRDVRMHHNLLRKSGAARTSPLAEKRQDNTIRQRSTRHTFAKIVNHCTILGMIRAVTEEVPCISPSPLYRGMVMNQNVEATHICSASTSTSARQGRRITFAAIPPIVQIAT